MINIFRNALFGDGHITEPNKKGTVQISFSSTQLSVIELKAKLLNSNIRQTSQHINAFGKKPLYCTGKRVFPENINKLTQINNLTIEDFYLWLIDDGSFHKTKHFMNLNSHALTRAENIELSYFLWHTHGIETRVYPEKKKDGRLFWYQYIPAAQVESILPEFKQFIITHNLYGFEYKVGKTSSTIGLTK